MLLFVADGDHYRKPQLVKCGEQLTMRCLAPMTYMHNTTPTPKTQNIKEGVNRPQEPEPQTPGKRLASVQDMDAVLMKSQPVSNK